MSTILIAEDNLEYREILTKKLKNEGYDVVVAGSGQEALEVVKNPKYSIDLILMDIIMPGMDGVSFYYHMGSILPKDTPVLILTNKEESAYPEGIKEYIIKSNISIEELVEKIKSYL